MTEKVFIPYRFLKKYEKNISYKSQEAVVFGLLFLDEIFLIPK